MCAVYPRMKELLRMSSRWIKVHLQLFLGINIPLWIYLIAEIQLRTKVSLWISFKADRVVMADLTGDEDTTSGKFKVRDPLEVKILS